MKKGTRKVTLHCRVYFTYGIGRTSGIVRDIKKEGSKNLYLVMTPGAGYWVRRNKVINILDY